jgi:hypothetical protein
MRRPEVGDHVKVLCPIMDDYRYGYVEALLSKQFTYACDKARIIRFAMYSDEWTVIE